MSMPMMEVRVVRMPVHEVDVPMHTYQKTRVGDRVCYGLHPGFLNGPWYTSVNCTEHPASSTP